MRARSHTFGSAANVLRPQQWRRKTDPDRRRAAEPLHCFPVPRSEGSSNPKSQQADSGRGINRTSRHPHDKSRKLLVTLDPSNRKTAALP